MNKVVSIIGALLILSLIAGALHSNAAEPAAGDEAVLKITGGVLAEPQPAGKNLFTIQKDERVKVIKVKGKWATIEDKQKRQGWVPIKSLEKASVPPPAAKIAYVKGDVQVIKPDGGKTPAQVGDALLEKDGVQTAAQSVADIEIIGGRNVVVNENSRVIVSHLNYAPKPKKPEEKPIIAQMKIELGRLFVSLRKALSKDEKFEIMRGTVVAGVRGTEFRMTAEQNETAKVEVTKSDITVTAANKTAPLKEDYGMRIKKGEKPGKPHKLPPSPELSSPELDTTIKTFDFTWKPVEGGKEYRFEIAKDPDFRQLVESTIVANVNYRPESVTLPLGDFYWRVSTIDKEDFEGKSSTPRKFTIAP
ncbi:MAG: hypothetical protein Kow0090_18820 [Myxococcota bacterium]